MTPILLYKSRFINNQRRPEEAVGSDVHKLNRLKNENEKFVMCVV